jgi:hypothetical protein
MLPPCCMAFIEVWVASLRASVHPSRHHTNGAVRILPWSPGVFLPHRQVGDVVCITAVYFRVVRTKGSEHKQLCHCSLTVGSEVAVWGGCMAARWPSLDLLSGGAGYCCHKRRDLGHSVMHHGRGSVDAVSSSAVSCGGPVCCCQLLAGSWQVPGLCWCAGSNV